MQKQITQFKSVINGIESLFHFDQTCSVDVAKQALFECLKWIGQIEDAVKAQQAAQAAAQPEVKAPDAPVMDAPQDPPKE